MVRTLLALVRSLRRAWLFELGGASLVTFAAYEWWGTKGACVAGGVALLLKSAEYDAGDS